MQSINARVTRPTTPPCGTPRIPRDDGVEWRMYDARVDMWLENARAYNAVYDDDEIATWIMWLECDEFYPHA